MKQLLSFFIHLVAFIAVIAIFPEKYALWIIGIYVGYQILVALIRHIVREVKNG